MASSPQLLLISTVIAIGTAIMNFLISKLRLLKPTTHHTSIHGYLAPIDALTPPSSPSLSPTKLSGEKHEENAPFLSRASSTRGYLPPLSLRQEQAEKQTLTTTSAAEELFSLLDEINDRHPRATYLGRSDDTSTDSCDCLFARRRVNGITKPLGDVARIRQSSGTVYLDVCLHPEDSHSLILAGWAFQTQQQTLASRLRRHFQQHRGCNVSLYPPRNQAELEQIHEKAIEASLSWTLRRVAEA